MSSSCRKTVNDLSPARWSHCPSRIDKTKTRRSKGSSKKIAAKRLLSGGVAKSRDNHSRSIFRLILDREQCFICILQGKHHRPRTNSQVSRQRQKITRILARHIRHAANLPLAPKQLVIIKRRHLVEVDGIDRDHSTFAQRRQGADDHLATGCEGDRPV